MGRDLRVAWRVFGVLSVAVATVPACSSSSSQDACVPPPESCDVGETSMHVYDATHDCLGAMTALVGVCGTSVDRCTPSAGIGVVCAVSASGVAYTAGETDNVVLTGSGWRFDQAVSSFPDPEEEVAEAEQVSGKAAALCARAECAPACPGVTLDDVQHFNCSDAAAP